MTNKNLLVYRETETTIMNQQFEQRELPVSKKDFAISQYEEFVKKLEESLKIETCEMAITYLEPSPSPEVDSILNTLLRLNARLMNVSNLNESTESVNVDEIIKDYVAQVGSMALEINEKDEEIETKEEEIAGYKKTVRDLELKIKELLRENESLKTSNTKKK